MLICRKSEKMPNYVDYVGDWPGKRLFSLHFFEQITTSELPRQPDKSQNLEPAREIRPTMRKSALAAAKGGHELHDAHRFIAAEQRLHPPHFSFVLRHRCRGERLLVLVEGVACGLLERYR
jgi:hypothetical protein